MPAYFSSVLASRKLFLVVTLAAGLSSGTLAFAGGNGSGHDGGGGGGNSGNNAGGNSGNNVSGGDHRVSGKAALVVAHDDNASETETSHNKSNPTFSSRLGSLNAAHASARAFANASPNSHIGRIKAYYLASVIAKPADDKVKADLAALNTANMDLSSANSALTVAQTNLTTHTGFGASAETITADQKPITVANANILAAQNAVGAATAALQADQALAVPVDKAAADALAAASNKPLDPATKLAFDTWLASMAYKFN